MSPAPGATGCSGNHTFLEMVLENLVPLFSTVLGAVTSKRQGPSRERPDSPFFPSFILSVVGKSDIITVCAPTVGRALCEVKDGPNHESNSNIYCHGSSSQNLAAEAYAHCMDE